jgi:hypothetical protein
MRFRWGISAEDLALDMEQYNDTVLLLEELDECEPNYQTALIAVDENLRNDFVEPCSKATSLSATGTKPIQKGFTIVVSV